MPYSEVHFNSAIYSSDVAYSGTRSRRVLELNNPLFIDKFHVKDLELPLTWCNVAAGSVHYVWTYSNSVWESTVPVTAGCYTGATFAQHLRAKFVATAMSKTSGAGLGPIVQTGVAFSYDDIGRLKIVVPTGALGDGQTYVSFQLTWSESLKKYLSRTFDDTDLTISTTTDTLLSVYPVHLVPNYVYLHSNLMIGTPQFSTQRAIGSHVSRTIVTKIQINTAYGWQNQVMPWINPNLAPEFMFDAHGQEYNRLEFWFTDEDGLDIDFRNVNFSLTLAVFYH